MRVHKEISAKARADLELSRQAEAEEKKRAAAGKPAAASAAPPPASGTVSRLYVWLLALLLLLQSVYVVLLVRSVHAPGFRPTRSDPLTWGPGTGDRVVHFHRRELGLENDGDTQLAQLVDTLFSAIFLKADRDPRMVSSS